MNAKPSVNRKTTFACRTAAATVLALCWTGWVGAQTDVPPARLGILPEAPGAGPTAAPASPEGGTPIHDSNVVQAGCSTCSGGLLGAAMGHGEGGGGGCGSGCCGGNCVPGRLNCCSDCEGRTALGRLLCGVYCCICCPDPCYEPCFIPAANASFFVDSARPVSQMRIRWDSGLNFTTPDRSEYFWARADGTGKGPKGREVSLSYNDLNVYTETAIGKKLSLFVNLPYRNVDPQVNNHAAGFGDMDFGTKTLLLDCELLQVAFQFRTYVPTGNFTKGVGNGHVSLEPSILATLKLTASTYLQGQLSEWIPLGGDTNYMGSILHYHVSLNQVLYRILPDVPIIGTMEFNGYSFQDGAFTDPVLGAFQKSSGDSWLSFGPGVRMDVCKKIDFGLGTAFGIGSHGPEQLYRTEFRWRF